MIGSDFPARVLEQGLAAASLRHAVLANNIANVNTPGFKRSRVEFEEHLAGALSGGGQADAVSPQVVVEEKTVARPDGNNVDIEGEMTELAQNQIWYSALTRQLSDHFRRLSTVIQDGRR
jgi:flagellar basal-body rod protein FlgB